MNPVESRPSRDAFCTYCRKPETDLPSGTKFKQCAKCNQAIGLKVVYCDKDCQLNDWKNGIPPHKKICGKQFIPPTTFPEPDAGFVRSRALLSQMGLLKSDPQLSYILSVAAPDPDVGIILPDPADAKIFEAAKHQAFKNADLGSVAVMCNLLIPIAEDFKISREGIIGQLSAEFEIPSAQLSEECQKLEDEVVLRQMEHMSEMFNETHSV